MERSQVIVVDASVVIKWFIEEEYSREARLLRKAYEDGIIDVAAPTLLPYEVLNALKYSGAFGEDELKEVASILDDFQFTLYNLEGKQALKAIELAMRKGITIYDASYVALALMLNTILYTADEKLLKKVHDLGVARHIKDFRI